MGNVIQLDNIQTNIVERVMLGSREGRREPEPYLPGLLLKGQSHLFYGASDTGKSWVALHASRESLHEGLPVLYFDLENGPDVVEERMIDTLGVSSEVLDSSFYYFPFHDLTLNRESKAWFTSVLDRFSEPGLIVWDSLLGHLTACELSEDGSNDFEQWASFYLDRARALGWTSQVLDHSGHAGNHARGTSRKMQSVQVSWKVDKKEPFDRTSEGRLLLTREKDRLAYLPSTIEVTLGNTPFGLKLRYDGQEFLGKNTNRALFLLYKFGPTGATHGEWKERCSNGEKKMSPATFNRAIGELKDKEYIDQNNGRYILTKKGESKVS